MRDQQISVFEQGLAFIRQGELLDANVFEITNT